MSFLQLQQNRDRNGKKYTYVYLARSEWQREKKYPRQRRTYMESK
jgi:hypothetical protein